MISELLEGQQAEEVFREGQNELSPQPQNFFDYWNDDEPLKREDIYFKIDDWDEFPSR